MPPSSQPDPSEVLRAMALLLHPESPMASVKSGVSLWTWDEPVRPSDFDLICNTIPFNMVTVDTLAVSIPISRIKVLANHHLAVAQSDEAELNRILFRDQDGMEVRGQSATWGALWDKPLNEPHLYLEISPLSRGWIEGDNIGCYIQFSIPGIRGHGDNSWPVDCRNATGIIDAVQNKLAALGLIVDLRQAKVVRCDLNRNVVLEEPFHHYQTILRALDLPRTNRGDYSRTGITRTNKSQSMVIYDKIAEMKSRGLSTTHLPPHFARQEWQVKTARNVSKKLEVKTVHDLLDSWDTLPHLYINQKNRFFCQDVDALLSPRPRCDLRNQTPIQSEISTLLRWSQKHGLEHHLDAQKLGNMVKHGNFHGLAKLIKSVPGMDKKHANTAIGRMRNAFWRENFQDADFLRRYKELKEKFGVSQGGAKKQPKCHKVGKVVFLLL
jgi:hypothetical protein